VCSKPNARQTLLRLIEQERVQQDKQKAYFLSN